MHKNLILLAFERAKENRKEQGDNDPKKTKIAEDISDYLDEQHGQRITPARLKQYHHEAEQIKNKKEDIRIAQIAVVYGLCEYLGFNSYKSFKMSTASLQEKIQYFLMKNKAILIISLITILICFIISFTSGQRWMVWDGLEYVEVSFDAKKLQSGELKLYNADKIRNFKKIPNPNCETVYKNEKGEVVTWYYKHGYKDLEVFTSPGVHPTNGKSLRDMTDYMIQTHICENY